MEKSFLRGGAAFISVRDADKQRVIALAKSLCQLGFNIVATKGTAEVLEANHILCTSVYKVTEARPNIVDMIKNDEINLVINTTQGDQAIADSYKIRVNAIQHKVCYTTTLAGAEAIVLAIQAGGTVFNKVNCLQMLHQKAVKDIDTA